METNVKVYAPATLTDEPFPTNPADDPTTVIGSAPATIGQTTPANNTTIPSQPMPIPQVAQQLISTKLNTITQKIIGQFQFTPSGSIKIGDYTQGGMGEIDISPNGIAAINEDGVDTFTLDGDTGEATFRGTVEAADFVIADAMGLVSLNNFSTEGEATAGINQHFTTSSLVDVTGSAIQFTLNRQSIVFLISYCTAFLIESAGNTADGQAVFNLDGKIYQAFQLNAGVDQLQSFSCFYPLILDAGIHNLKLQADLITIHAGSPSMVLYDFRLDYLALGS